MIFNADILLEELPHPTYLAAAPEYERNVEDMEYFNAGVLVMNIQGMKEKYEEFILKMKNRERKGHNCLFLRNVDPRIFKRIMLQRHGTTTNRI